jgi:hypothetical protein
MRLTLLFGEIVLLIGAVRAALAGEEVFGWLAGMFGWLFLFSLFASDEEEA